LSGPSTTPAANHLFTVNPKSQALDVKNADLFHRMTAQLLYLSKVQGQISKQLSHF
jgi:hypothetical protein